MVPTRVARAATKAAASRGDVDRIGRMASGYANTSLSGRQFNGEATGSGSMSRTDHASPEQRIGGRIAERRAGGKDDRRSVVMDVRLSIYELRSVPNIET